MRENFSAISSILFTLYAVTREHVKRKLKFNILRCIRPIAVLENEFDRFECEWVLH